MNGSVHDRFVVLQLKFAKVQPGLYMQNCRGLIVFYQQRKKEELHK